MTYNSLNNNQSQGLIYFINDLNQRFTDLLFASQTNGEDDYNRRFSGLARLDVGTGIPHTKDSDGEYSDSLFDDNYDIVTFFLESGDRKFLKAAATESKPDLYVSVNMDSFSNYEEEGIIDEVFNVMKTTAFEAESLSRDEAAIKAFNYEGKVPDSMSPYFIFKISSKLVGNLKVN